MPLNPLHGRRFEPYWQGRPLTVVDIGARFGVSPRWRPARPHLRVVAFEPDAEECARLQSRAEECVTYLPTGVLEQAGTMRLNLTRAGGGSSAFQPNSEFLARFPDSERFDVVKVAEVQADSLDATLTGAGIGYADIIKIDTQGSELAIMRGGARTLSRAFALEVEVEFADLYEGQPLFADVDVFAREAGFSLFDLRCHRWKDKAGMGVGGPKGRLVFADALYMRDTVSLGEVLAGEGEGAAPMLVRALALCLLYGYYDHALALLVEHGRVLRKEDATWLAHAIRRRGQRASLCNIPGVGRVTRALRDLADALEPGLGGWATSDNKLGNRRLRRA